MASAFLIVFLSGALLLMAASALASLFVKQSDDVLQRVAFPLLTVSSIFSLLAGITALFGHDHFFFQLPLGLPWLHWHLRLDALSGFFLILIGVGTFVVSIYGPTYVREYMHGPYSLRVLGCCTALFILGMQLVVLADDVFVFMIAWELMSLSSYFLVAFQHQNEKNHHAAYIYLVMAQVGGLAILMSFAILAGFAEDYRFEAIRENELSFFWASMSFGLAVLGFGMKAGLVPLHVWLPDAHPAAPAHISALMSGVMLKIAVYGFIRVSFDLLPALHWSWGVALLIIACITALFGVLYALVQHDIKRLLAYHSIENIGIIFIGLALSIIFFGTEHPLLGSLGLIAALYHTLNHMLFKSLLFLGAGILVQRSGEHDLENMGGLIRFLPWTGLFFLIGCISISALPPFNGFVSEWLTFQTALQVTNLDSGVLRAVIPIAAAVLALTGALAVACFVKVYGVAFLGQARSTRIEKTTEAPKGMLYAQGLLAVLCLLFGVFPTATVSAFNQISQDLTGYGLQAATSKGWMWLTPISSDTASYGAPLVLLGILLALAAWASVFVFFRPRGKAPTQRGETWDCGFGPLNPRMQYTATAFSMPIRRIFSPAWKIQENARVVENKLIPMQARSIKYQLHTQDHAWFWFYQPVLHWVEAAVRNVGKIQTGHLRHYLAYSFVTLIILLWIIT